MKKSLITLAFACFLLAFAHAATLTVNNNYPNAGQYSTVQAAVDAAASGDIILIQGSVTTYGTVTLPKTKALTLRGPGWNPTLRPSIYKATLGSIFLEALAHDIVIEGLTTSGIFMNYVSGNGTTTYGQYNIKVQYCSGAQIYANAGCHDFIIQNNSGIVVVGYPATISNPPAYNILIQYNVLGAASAGVTGFAGYTAPNGNFITPTNIRIDHNVFLARISYLNGVTITNNIFYTADVSSSDVNRCIITNNLTYGGGSSFFSGNYLGNNIINTNPLFVAPNTSDYHLQATSPCKNAGTDGKDLGIYTDVMTFSRTGELIPVVRSFQVTNPVSTATGSFNFKMTASKAHDGN